LPTLRMGLQHPLRLISEVMDVDPRSPDASFVGGVVAWLVHDSLLEMAMDEAVPVDMREAWSFFGIRPSRDAFIANLRKRQRLTWKEGCQAVGPSVTGQTRESMSPLCFALEAYSECVPVNRSGYEAWTRFVEANGGLFFATPKKEKSYLPPRSTWSRLFFFAQKREVETLTYEVPAWFLEMRRGSTEYEGFFGAKEVEVPEVQVGGDLPALE